MTQIGLFVTLAMMAMQLQGGQQAMKLHKEVLHTQVRVRAVDAGGSGTIIRSEKGKNGFYSTYIITCHHVIEKAVQIENKWDSLLKRERKMETMIPVLVEMFSWSAVPHGKTPLTSGAQAEIVAYGVDDDIAILHLDLAERPAVAEMLPPEKIQSVIIGSEVYAVGCALLHDPILTAGHVTHMGDIIDGKDYWMSSAQTIFGNSGGAVFTLLDDRYYFIGIPSRISVIGWATPITHMGYFSPVSRIQEFLKEQILDFLIPGSKKTEEECLKEREEKKKLAQDFEEDRLLRDLTKRANLK